MDPSNGGVMDTYESKYKDNLFFYLKPNRFVLSGISKWKEIGNFRPHFDQPT
jgi:hypothetical protein